MPKSEETINALLDLPVTAEDYRVFCRNNNFGAIEAVSKRLLSFESHFINNESVNHILANGCVAIGFASSLHQRAQTLALGSFERISKYFNGKPIFVGFIPEKKKYISGAIIPMSESIVLIIYLPTATNLPNLLFPPFSSVHKIKGFTAELIRMWIDEVINSC